jgi:hypothetical protein
MKKNETTAVSKKDHLYQKFNYKDNQQVFRFLKEELQEVNQGNLYKK